MSLRTSDKVVCVIGRREGAVGSRAQVGCSPEGRGGWGWQGWVSVLECVLPVTTLEGEGLSAGGAHCFLQLLGGGEVRGSDPGIILPLCKFCICHAGWARHGLWSQGDGR